MKLAARPSRRRKAFSLIEIILVLALLGTLSTLVIVNVANIFGNSNTDIADSFVNGSVDASLLQYLTHMGRYPSSEEGLGALKKAPAGAEGRWRGPYIKDLPEDPWGNDYQYKYPGTHNPESYDIWSLGPDGVPSDDDIGNWEDGQA